MRLLRTDGLTDAETSAVSTVSGGEYGPGRARASVSGPWLVQGKMGCFSLFWRMNLSSVGTSC